MFKEFYGEFYRILDACADSAYQALFSAYEKEPGVEATLSQNLSELLARMRRCFRVVFPRALLNSYSRPRPAPKALGVVTSSKVPRVHVT